MLNTLFDSVKGDRRMSFEHWRYRLLHWCFSVSPASPDESKLPRALYTHYCPLFHLTNLIAIFSPVILLLKILRAIGRLLIVAAFAIHRSVAPIIRKAFSSGTTAGPIEKTAEQLAADDLLRLRDLILLVPVFTADEFERFWSVVSGQLPHMQKDVAESEFIRVINRIVQSRLRAEQRRQKQRAMILFWVGFSRGLIKAVLTILYAAVFCVALMLTLVFGNEALQLVFWLASEVFQFIVGFDVAWFLRVVFRATLIIGTICGVGYLLWKFRAHLDGPFESVVEKSTPPLRLARDVSAAFLNWIGSAITAVREFVAVFYEENCPPIQIVAEEDDELSKTGAAS